MPKELWAPDPTGPRGGGGGGTGGNVYYIASYYRETRTTTNQAGNRTTVSIKPRLPNDVLNKVGHGHAVI